jgi:hypothetical protein
MAIVVPLIDTLGQQLDDQARRIAAHRLPQFPWARPLAALLDHLTSFPAPLEDRFRRTEAPLYGEDLAARRPGGEVEPGIPAIYRAADGRPLPFDVQARLREVTGPGVEAVRVHDDAAAGETARAHRADAVAVGSDVFFGEGQFRPREPRGFALLAHETTHVLELLRPGVSWRRATQGGVQEEEKRALGRERALVSPPLAGARWDHAPASGGLLPMRGQPASSPERPPGVSPAGVPHGLAAAITPASPALHPMAAANERDLSPGGQAAAPPSVDLDVLRRSLVQDLMRQLRAEFERGG